eukprot:s301_g6.t1
MPIWLRDAVSMRKKDESAPADVLTKLLDKRFTPNSRPMLHKCFQFDPASRINILEILLTLKGLTPQDLEKHGMDRRRTG